MMNSPASWLKDPWSTAAAWFHSRPSDDCGQILSVSTYLAKPNTGSPSHTNPPSLYSADCFLLMPSHHPYPQLIIHPFSSTSRIYQRSHLSRITASCLLLKTLPPMGPALTTYLNHCSILIPLTMFSFHFFLLHHQLIP